MNIYEKLMNIQTELKAPKDQRNTFGNYNYRSCEDILEGLKPLLLANRTTLVLDDEIVQIGDRYYVKAMATLIDVDQEEKTIRTKDNCISSVAYAREDENKKGMDLAQITGSVSSYARKYALNALFAIDDARDSDSTNKHGKETKEPTQSAKGNLSEGQINRLYAIAKAAGVSQEQVKSSIKNDYKKDDEYALTRKEYDELCNRLEKAKK